MEQLDRYQVEQHIVVLGWLYIVMNAFFLVIGAFVFILLPSVGVASGEPEAVAVLGAVGTSVGLLLALIGLPGMIAGYGLLKHREWGRILAIVLGIINIVNFPIGTLIGFYAVWVLMQDSAIQYFGRPTHT